MLGWLERHQALLLLGAVALLLSGLVAQRLDGPSPPALVLRDGPLLPDGSPIRVQVAGAVARPGVYDLRAGDRVTDLLDAAGGASPGASLDTLNLARRLRDGEKLVVPGPAAASLVATLPSPAGKLDINSASQSQLDTLPGIGEAYSRRIVDSRRVDGPFRTTQELVTRRVVPQATFEQIRDLITAVAP